MRIEDNELYPREGRPLASVEDHITKISDDAPPSKSRPDSTVGPDFWANSLIKVLSNVKKP